MPLFLVYKKMRKCYNQKKKVRHMITFTIDESTFDKKFKNKTDGTYELSHYEIRKRKDRIVLVAVPKAKTLEEFEIKDGLPLGTM